MLFTSVLDLQLFIQQWPDHPKCMSCEHLLQTSITTANVNAITGMRH